MVFVNQQKLCSPPLLLKWVKELENTATNLPINNIPDVIEMDEIKKRGNRVLIWLSYARNRGKVVAYKIGISGDNAISLYNETKQKVCNIGRIYTDGNSCYSSKFSAIGISDLHFIAKGKSKTHMIEAVNSSIRDNLARFNRKSKRYSKSIELLDATLFIFFFLKQYKTSILN